MAEFKGTPGPWIKDVRKRKIVAIIPKKYGKITRETVLQIGSISDDDCSIPTCCCVEEHANAKLITAAPDMLEALEFIAMVVKSRGHDPNKLQVILEFAERAINKAI